MKNTYFQPPPTVKMVYPCAVYELDSIDDRPADDGPYITTNGYSVTIIDKDPDSEYPAKMKAFRYHRFVRFYTADNLNHWVFRVFY